MAPPEAEPVLVRRKLAGSQPASQLAEAADKDRWKAFRQIEIVAFKLEFDFRHSLGKCSRFFLELERRRLLATRCPQCGMVWMPPRAVCGDHLVVTEWVELTGRGSLAAATECAYTLQGALARSPAQEPTQGGQGQATQIETMVLGYIALEGASTLLLQRIKGFGGKLQRLRPGSDLKIAWSDRPVNHPIELFWFEPSESEDASLNRGEVQSH